MKRIVNICDYCNEKVDELFTLVLPNAPNDCKDSKGRYYYKKIQPIPVELCADCCYNVSNAILQMKLNIYKQNMEREKEIQEFFEKATTKQKISSEQEEINE